MLLFSSSLKLVAEIALMALLGQWLLGLLAGARRDSNIFYQILQVITRPFIRVARLLSPKQLVLDRHVPLVAFLLVLMIWVFATILKIQTCVEIGVKQCQ
jgi:hypothetical protein